MRNNLVLRTFQEDGVRFMIDRENSPEAGGIQADEMGLGKTIQTIALVMRKPCKTVVVVPSRLLSQWREQIDLFADEAAKVNITLTTYHRVVNSLGRPMCSSCDEGVRHDTFKFHKCMEEYEKCVSEMKVGLRSIVKPNITYKHPLPDSVVTIEWDRVVLDEAHEIRNTNSQRFLACQRIKARYRWCLSGTPVQNKMGDLVSLFRFLRLDLSRFCCCLRRCNSLRCVHKMERFGIIKKFFEANSIRRFRKDVLDLPNLDISIDRLSLNETELRHYDCFEQNIQSHCIDGDSEVHLAGILRLRQVVLSPQLLIRDFNDEFCPLCCNFLKTGDHVRLMVCGHVCHHDCSTFVEGDFCSLCIDKQPILADFKWCRSTKIDAIIDRVLRLAGSRVIVFTYFKVLTHIISRRLTEEDVSFDIIDGDVSLSSRDKIIERFKRVQSVLIISLDCGTLGLNLQCASSIIIACPWWNPATEDQAISRCYRMGQLEEVKVWTPIVTNTIDERMLQLQERKRCLRNHLVDECGAVQAMEDLRFLIGL